MEHKLSFIQTDSELEIKIQEYRRTDSKQQNREISNITAYGTIANDWTQISTVTDTLCTFSTIRTIFSYQYPIRLETMASNMNRIRINAKLITAFTSSSPSMDFRFLRLGRLGKCITLSTVGGGRRAVSNLVIIRK